MAEITDATRTFAWNKLQSERRDLDGYHGGLYFPSGALIGDRLYILGTKAGSCCCLDIETQKWRTCLIEEFKDISIEHVLVDECIMGVGARSEGDNIVEVLDVVLNSCIERPVTFPGGPLSRNFTSDYVEFKRQIAVFGGSANDVDTAQLCFVDVDTFEVTSPRATGSSPSPRSGHTSCVVNGFNETTVFVYGGRRRTEYYHDLHLLHCHRSSLRWSRARDNTATGCYASSLTYIAGKLFLYGGYDSSHVDLDDFRIYELRNKTWHELGSKGEYRITTGEKDANSGHYAANTSKGLLFIGGFGDRPFPWTCVVQAND